MRASSVISRTRCSCCFLVFRRTLFTTRLIMAQEYKLKAVTSLSQLTRGEKQEAEVEGIDDAKVLLVNSAGKIQALGPKCTHYGAPLAKGVLSTNGRLLCLWFGACFFACSGV